MKAIVIAGLVLLAAGPARADGIETADQPPHERCATCHELDGNSRAGRFPRLAGQTVAYLDKQLRDFRAGKRGSPMQATAELLSDAEVAELARHFSQQPLRATGARRQGRPALSAERLHRNGDRSRGVRACGSCHGRRGEGKGTNPRLAGQHAEYLEAQLLLFREGKRINDDGVMRAIAAAATRPELQALARYFAGLEGP